MITKEHKDVDSMEALLGEGKTHTNENILPAFDTESLDEIADEIARNVIEQAMSDTNRVKDNFKYVLEQVIYALEEEKAKR